MCDRNTIGDFGIDCNEMISEIEKEVQTTQFRMEAKQEVAEIVNPRKEDFKSSVIDLEFEDAVREYKNR